MASSRKLPQPDLAQRVAAVLAGHPHCRRLCVGLSGGLDSVVLLHLLASLRDAFGLSLTALHVHHGLSAKADDWARFAVDFAGSLAAPCTVRRVTVDTARVGIEAGARAARYAEFAAVVADAVVLAHHRDDQAETVLFNVVRGAGLAGIAAMPILRSLQPGLDLLRPLLDVPRAALAAYAAVHALDWVDDDSNADPAYDRNYLRLVAMPVLRQRFPGVDEGLARAARHAAEAEALLGEYGRQDVAACLNEAGGLDLHRAALLGELRACHALRSWLQQLGARPDERAFDALWQQRGTEALCWRWHRLTLRSYRGVLYVAPDGVPAAAMQSCPFLPFQKIPLEGGVLRWQRGWGLRESLLAQGGLELRPRSGGERLRARPGGPSRALKQLCQEAGLPPWLRTRTPLLYLNGELAALPGVAVAAELAEEGGWWPMWQAVPAGPNGG